MRGIAVRVPESIDIQKTIGHFLDSIDTKIEINRKINENLLQQASASFNKLYDESPNQQPFTSLIDVLGGGTPKTGNPDFWDGPIPFFTPKDVGTPYTFQTEKYITESGLTHCNSRLYQKDTTFVTARGTVGKVSLAGTPMAMNQSCYALASEIVDPLLVYFYVLKAVASLKHKASGAVFDAIVTRDFDGETINVLSDDDAKYVLAIIKPMMEAIHNNIEENIRLVALRDSLLPRLMSGELDVSELDL
jgi:type I restriction enzyme S subunit